MKFEEDMGIEEIKVIKNFLSPEETKFFIDYIDNIDDMLKEWNGAKFERKVLMFGKDGYRKEKSDLTLEKIKDIEPMLRSDLFPRIEASVKEVYKNKKDLMVCAFYLAKQVAGGKIEEHVDNDGGANMQLKYGGVIYLNKMKSGGELKFTKLGHKYTPEPGDLVVFPSRPPQYLHTVNEISEDRYSLPVWVTEYPFWKL